MVGALTLNNSLGITLKSSLLVDNALNLTAGVLSLEPDSVLSLESSGSVTRGTGFVDGNFRRKGWAGTEFTYPIGSGVSYAPVTFLSPIITATQSHNVAKTQLIGRRFTVKEHISISDYNVSVGAVIYGINENGLPAKNIPYDELTRIREYFATPIAKPVNNKFLNALGIYELVIEEFSPFAIPNTNGQIGIELRLVSDEPIELQEELSQ
jgi:hypothetical protein